MSESFLRGFAMPVYSIWYMTDGRVLEVCDYGRDVGNLHVIDYYLTLLDLPAAYPGHTCGYLRSPADWSQP